MSKSPKPAAMPKTNTPEPQPPATVTPDRPVMGALIDPMGHRPEAKPTTRKNTVQPIAEPAVDKFKVYEARAAAKLVLTDLNLEERAFLGTCQDLYRNDRGSHTPFENFIHTIIRWTTWGNPPTPEHLLDEIRDNFQLDWGMTVHAIARFAKNYPDELSAATATPPATPELLAAEQTTQPATKRPAKAQRSRKPRKKVARAAA